MQTPTLDQLNDRFAIAHAARVIPANGGLPAVRVEHQGTQGLLYLHGAHVAAFQPAHTGEVLWLSGRSAWEPGKAIRGGVPLCFPWFGPRKDSSQSPIHGLARLRTWDLEAIEDTAEGIRVSLALRDDESLRAAWPHPFMLRHRVTFGRKLVMALELVNTGQAPLTAEMAQHTYFSVGDVRQVRIVGLDAAPYVDRLDGGKTKLQSGPVVIAAETDRLYLNTHAPVSIEDPLQGRRITLVKEHSPNTVVWNPWIAKAKAMADFGDEEWPGMLCVETAAVGDAAATLAPGCSYIMQSTIAVEKL